MFNFLCNYMYMTGHFIYTFPNSIKLHKRYIIERGANVSQNTYKDADLV